jgi:hypothetical protein
VSYSGKVTPGSTGNVLTFMLADTSDAIYDSTIYVSNLSVTAGVSVHTLRNFDVISPPDLPVNDFHITLEGITNPELPRPPDQPEDEPYLRAHISSIYPSPLSYHPLPPGWTPEEIEYRGSDSVIKWGPGQYIQGQKLHFGVTLSPAGEAALQDCV